MVVIFFLSLFLVFVSLLPLSSIIGLVVPSDCAMVLYVIQAS